MENDRITLQVYDWNPSHEGFLSFLWNKFAINPETYQLLDCIARQTIMRIGGFKFDFDYINHDLKIDGTNYSDYLMGIKAHILKVEENKRIGYQQTIDAIQKINAPRTGPFYIPAPSSGPRYFACIRDENGREVPPNYFLEYGFERWILEGLHRNIDNRNYLSCPYDFLHEYEMDELTEDDIEWIKNDLKKSFGKDEESASGRVLQIKKDFISGTFDPFNYTIQPTCGLLFSSVIAAYYSVFSDYLEGIGEDSTKSGLNKFIAMRLESSLGGFSQFLESKTGHSLKNAFLRTTIKDRIKNNEKYFTNYRDEAHARGLSTPALAKHL
jgi:hypothetical protein